MKLTEKLWNAELPEDVTVIWRGEGSSSFQPVRILSNGAAQYYGYSLASPTSWREDDHPAMIALSKWLVGLQDALNGKDTRPALIVGEVSANYPHNEPGENGCALLSTRFEFLCKTNRERGFKLHSWQLDRKFMEGQLNETIIAVFEKEG